MEGPLAQIVGILLRGCVLITVFALGLRASWRDVASLVHRPGLLARSLLAMYVLTPLAAVLLVLAFSAPVPVEMAVVLMAISAGAPVLPKRLFALGADPPYVYSLSVIAALLAILTVPVSLVLLSKVFHIAFSLPPREVAIAIGTTFLAPLLVGMVVAHVRPAFAERISEPCIRLSGAVLIGLIVLLVAVNSPAMLSVGLSGLAIIAAVTVAALAIGHALGGPDPNDRTALALVCATRFPALVLLIASLNFPKAKPLPVVAAYLVFSTIVTIPYIRWRKSRLGATAAVSQP
jgi:BASS family bile acid:Na+ symporter